MANPSHPVSEWLRQALGPVPASLPAPDAPELGEWIRHNRLGPWLYASGVPLPAGVMDRAAFRAQSLRSERLLRAGVVLGDALRAAGIPCLAHRGPFHGAWLYGDPSLRPAQDIDLLVPRTNARGALAVARAQGYRAAIPGQAEGFYLRHHLHWQLHHPADGVLCDLHWAVDHPYRLHRVDYPTLFARAQVQSWEGLAWSRPGVEHALLLDLLHFHKHFGLVHDHPGEWTRVCALGEAIHLLDAARLVRAHGASLDWEFLLRSAAAWRVEREVLPALRLAAEVFSLDLPASVRNACPAGEPGPPVRPSPPFWLRPVAALGGFRPEKWHDAAAYVWPDPRKLGRGGRVLRVVRAPAAALRVAVAGLDILACHWAAGKTASPPPAPVHPS